MQHDAEQILTPTFCADISYSMCIQLWYLPGINVLLPPPSPGEYKLTNQHTQDHPPMDNTAAPHSHRTWRQTLDSIRLTPRKMWRKMQISRTPATTSCVCGQIEATLSMHCCLLQRQLQIH